MFTVPAVLYELCIISGKEEVNKSQNGKKGCFMIK